MKSPDELLHESERRLNQALADYEAPPTSALAREFYELRLQAAIFNFDISYDTVAIWRSKPSGFAEKVALKSLIHRLYEYDQLNQKHLVPRILALAKARNVSVTREHVSTERKKWKLHLSRLSAWSGVRNQATGHYGRDIESQVRLLKTISRKEVMDVSAAFLSYNVAILKALASTGRANGDA